MSEIVTCPACAKKLQVPEDFFGKTVQCPECKQQFVPDPGLAPAASAAPPAQLTTDLFPARRPSPEAEEDDDCDDRRRSRRRDRDDYERPHRRSDVAPHRGGMILAFGILAIIGVGALIFGPLAWLLGNADLAAMRAGRMDPSGEGQTNAGRILGMIATLLIVISLLVVCGIFGLLFVVGLVGGAAHR